MHMVIFSKGIVIDMENKKINSIIEQIKALENELETEAHKEYEKFNCEISQKKEQLLEMYKSNKEGLFKYLATAPLSFMLTFPIVWSVLFPAFILDLFVTIYQAICFPIYKIPKVKRGEYIVIDRHRLGYLNIIEKLNCLYCSYFNGLMGYVSEVAGRTEQFWCPIRHANMTKSIHRHYPNFLQYGDSKEYHKNLDKLREKTKEFED